MPFDLTHFALIEMEHRKSTLEVDSSETQRYFLRSALVFGLDDDYWWTKVEDVSLKMDVVSSLISPDNDATTTRVVGHLLKRPGIDIFEGNPFGQRDRSFDRNCR